MGYFRADRLMAHEDRCLDFNVFLYITEGIFEVWEERIEYIIPAGETFFLKKGAHHWGDLKIPAGTSCYWVHFYDHSEANPYNDLREFNAYLKSGTFLQEDYEYNLILPKQCKVKTPKLMEKKLYELLTLYQTENLLRPLYLSLGISEIFLDLYRQERENHHIAKSDILVQKIIRYLEENNRTEIHAKEIADSLNLNYNYISSLFKKKIGISISEYFTRLRIHRSTQLLKESSLSISQISDRMGFQNPYYFSSVFKKVMGIPPSEYIKQLYRNT